MEEAPRLTRRAALGSLAASLAALLAACGRKGPLEPPPGALPQEERRKPRE